jgi:hypothetical protein
VLKRRRVIREEMMKASKEGTAEVGENESKEEMRRQRRKI